MFLNKFEICIQLNKELKKSEEGLRLWNMFRVNTSKKQIKVNGFFLIWCFLLFSISTLSMKQHNFRIALNSFEKKKFNKECAVGIWYFSTVRAEERVFFQNERKMLC